MPGRILVVDDDWAIREVLSEYFSGKGYTVETASDGEEALALMPGWRPDIVLLDIRMPGLDGVEVLRRIRAADERLPVIMVTADEDVTRAQESVKLGAFEYVTKPFDFAHLDQAVTLGLQATERPAAAASPTAGAEGAGDLSGAWKALAIAAFRTARQMAPAGRESTAARMESAALAAACEAAGGRAARAAEALRELDVLVTIAAELGDLPPPARAAMEAAMTAVRRSTPPPG